MQQQALWVQGWEGQLAYNHRPQKCDRRMVLPIQGGEIAGADGGLGWTSCTRKRLRCTVCS